MKFLVDNQLPVALAKLLRAAGHDALHVQDLGLGAVDDEVVWRRAVEEGRAIVSKDEDFLHRANGRNPGVLFLWIRLGNCRNQQLLAAMERVLPEILKIEAPPHRVLEIR